MKVRQLCLGCEDAPARFVAVLTALDGVIVDRIPLCEECVKDTTFTVGDVNQYPKPPAP